MMSSSERYIINGESFKNKKEITEKCRAIINKNLGGDLFGDDLQFMIQILKFHSDKERLICAKRIFINIDPKYQNNPCCYIEYITGEIRDISWTKCILHIPFGETSKIDWRLPFGKYKDESLYDIFDKDPRYLHWLSGQEWLSRDLKTKLNQMIRYGHIPYNPIAHKHAIENKTNNEKELQYYHDYDNVDIDIDYS